MGACASVPKAMRGKAAAAPAPEPPKEEIPTTDAAAVKEEAKAEEPAEKKADGEDKNEDKAVEDQTQSLGNLLVDEGEAPKEAAKEVIKFEESTADAPAAPEAAAADDKEEKKTEVAAEQK